MRTRKLTRRSCLVVWAVAGATWSWAHGQEPRETRANRGPKSAAIPVASRSVQLAPVVSQLARTVITAVSADPRGQLVAVAGDDHAIRILDATSLRTVKTLEGHRDLIRTLAFDRQGEKLVSAGNDGQLIVWDRDGNFRILQRMSGTPAIACVRFSPAGNEMAAVGFDRKVYLIGRGRKPSPALQCDCSDLRAVAYRDDNEMLAVAGRSGDLHLFDPDSGKLLGEHTIHRGRIHAMEFQRDSNLLISVAEDGTIAVFDTKQQRMLRQIPVTSGKLFAVAVLDSRQVAVAGSDNDIRVIDVESKQHTHTLAGHHGSVAALSASGNILFSGGFDATLRRWSLTELRDQERIAGSDPTVDRQ